MPRIAIVAAMEREVAPLIRSWRVRWIERDGHKYKLFENGDTSLVCCGIGPEAARRAAEAVIRETHPDRVVSVGFAGALDPALAVGDIVEPQFVINASDGARIDIGSGRGTVVSSGSVAGVEQKNKLRQAFSAAIVDMEAAAVAQAAGIRKVSFSALKVVSDDADAVLPPLHEFVAAGGSFRSARFALYVAVRPWFWSATMALAKNSAKASRSLCAALERYLSADVTPS
jgi:adenosylhomocysteine nucleosidase